MKLSLKPVLLAAALTLAAIHTASAIGSDTEDLRGWQEDFDLIRSFKHDPNPAVRQCVADVAELMKSNKGAIKFGFPNVKIFLPAANHFRENTIMPRFHACLAEARE